MDWSGLASYSLYIAQNWIRVLIEGAFLESEEHEWFAHTRVATYLSCRPDRTASHWHDARTKDPEALSNNDLKMNYNSRHLPAAHLDFMPWTVPPT